MQVTDRIKELIEPIAREREYYIVDITYGRESGKLVLRVVLDKESGINIDECARLNNKLSELLEKENMFNEEYVLEVSSPGLDRKLVKESDFLWAVGKNVKITTYAPIDGKNVFEGALVGLGEGTVVIDESGITREIARDKIANAKRHERVNHE